MYTHPWVTKNEHRARTGWTPPGPDITRKKREREISKKKEDFSSSFSFPFDGLPVSVRLI
jgi:hypothetical protein